VGGQEWKPVGDWPALAAAVAPTAPTMQPVLPQATVSAIAPVLTNPLLPSMANWICAYAILLSPFLWVVQNFSCCVTFSSPYGEGSGFDEAHVALAALDWLSALGVVILLFVGGIRLKALRRSGVSILKAALWGSLGRVAVILLGHIVLGVIAGVFAAPPVETTSSTTAQELISFASVILGVAELAFQIVALIWLHRNTPNLPLPQK
jgi:hypothetical protein